MPAVTCIHVSLGSRSHDILIGEHLLPGLLKKHPLLREKGVRTWIVADHHLKPLARNLSLTLGKSCAGCVLLPGRDTTKNITTLSHLYKAAAHARLDRYSIIIAIGGGVIGDVVGFFAATYLRGIQIIHIPTTLVAQVDSAIGGKTGINLPEGKNLVGAFHQPSLIVADTATLRSLPEREFRSGLAEVIKYGIITDPVLFRRLELRMKSILQRDPRELAWIIHRCCSIKARVVARDEHETQGLRATLNFGHTLGHGIESAAHYALLHGEAIALGMIGATRLSREMQGLSSQAANRIEHLIQSAGLPTHLKLPLPNSRILATMRLDKKAVQGQICFVLARAIGSVSTGIPVSKTVIFRTLSGLQRA